MKRRKHGAASTARAPNVGRVATRQPAPDDIVAMLMEQTARTEIKEKLEAKQWRRNGRAKSKQPPLSEEIKTVTEIGSGRWKPGQTQ